MANLMDAEAVQAVVQAAVAAAVQTVMTAQAAAGGPLPVVFAITPGVINADTLWNYGTSEGRKDFIASTLPLSPLYDGNAGGLKITLKMIDGRGEAFGWGAQLLTVPDSNGVGRKLTTQYGMLTLANVRAHAATYVGTETRTYQASKQLATCIEASLTKSIHLKLMLRAADYTINGIEEGACMLKTLISVVSIETRATVSCVRTALKSLPSLMDDMNSDITLFNVAVGELIDKLNSMDETSDDLLNHLFEAYQTVADKKFVDYIAEKESKWEDNSIEDLLPATLMTMAEDKFKTLTQKKLWNKPSKEEENIVALKAEIVHLVALQATVKTGKDPKAKKRKEAEWAWKLVAPTGTQPKEKSSKGKDYVYCPFHESTKWVLKGNHANGCDNDPQNKDTSAAAGKPPTGKPPDKRTLQYAKALMVAMESAEEGDEEQDPGDEEI
jgi:hypothetical protein